MRILFLSPWFPYPTDNGSKLRIFNLLRGLSQRHEVTLYSFSERPDDPTPPELSEICPEVVKLPVRPYRPTSLRALAGLLSPRPRVLVDRHAPEMEALIREACEGGRFDLVIASQYYMAAYLENLPGIPAVFEELEISVHLDLLRQAPNAAARLRYSMMAAKMSRHLRRLLPRFEACTVASEQELALVRAMAPGYERTVVVPNGTCLEDGSATYPPGRPDRLVFAGSLTFNLNYDAMVWFTERALPLIHEQRPDVGLTITGNHADLPLGYEKGVERTGLVPDVRSIVASSWASLAPLQRGGGTRLKILEAMALGTPVVATTKGAEGLDAVPGEHLLLADTPEDYAAACLRLLGDPELRRRLAANAVDLVRRKYAWEVILPGFLNLVERAASGRRGAAAPAAAV